MIIDINKCDHKNCKGAKPYTGGCIALDQDHIETILKTCSPGMRIVINEIY